MFLAPHHRSVAGVPPSYPTPLQEWDFTQTAGNTTPAVVGDTDLVWTVGGLPLIVSGAGTQVQDEFAYIEHASDANANIAGLNYVNDESTLIWAFTACDINSFYNNRSQVIAQFSKGNHSSIWATATSGNDCTHQHGNLGAQANYNLDLLPGWDGDIEGMMMLQGAGNQPTNARGMISTPQGTIILDETALTVRNKAWNQGNIVYIRLPNDDNSRGYPFTVKRGALWDSMITDQEAQAFIDAWKV